MSSKEDPEETAPSIPPPGMEVLFTHEFPADCTSPFAAFILAVHWSILHTTHLRLESNTGSPTERLPSNWPSQISQRDGASSRYIELKYKNAKTDRTLTLKVQELSTDDLAAVLITDDIDKVDKPDKPKSSVTTMNIDEYVNISAVKESQRDIGLVFHVPHLWKLEGIVKNELLKDEEDARKVDVYKEPKSPYSSNLSKSQEASLSSAREARLEQERASRSSITDPLRSERILPQHNPLRDIGRSDLDPFSSIIGGGMLMDPRGFRRPNLPQGIPPGARFDPIGPLGGFGPRGGFRGGGGAPPLPFGFPNPDHERMPDGFDDMFM